MNRVPLDALIDSACKVYSIDRARLGRGWHHSPGALARRSIVYLAKGEGYRQAEIARALNRHEATICENLKAAKAAYGTDPQFTDRVRAVWSNVAELA